MAGLFDARLGGFLLKKRIARSGQGKRGGFRSIVAYRKHERLVFLFLFAKNEQENITRKEHLVLLEIGHEYMQLTSRKFDELIVSGALIEVECDAKETEPNPR